MNFEDILVVYYLMNLIITIIIIFLKICHRILIKLLELALILL